MLKSTTILCASFLLCANCLFAADPDSIIFNNGNYMVGEAKSMDKGVLMVKTAYSDQDFAIEWEGIREIYCKTFFLVTLSDGTRLNGNIRTSEAGKVWIIDENGRKYETPLDQIVFLDDVDKGFWSRLYASIDVGLDLTKANNFRQVSMRSALGYLAERWTLGGTFNTLNSSQEGAENIKRTDASAGFKYYLPRDWYLVTQVNFLSNTEQKLDLRTTGKVGLGKYLVHTNRKYFGFSIGANYNNENFSTDAGDRNSMEGFAGMELNLFDVGNLDLLTNLVAYPSFTESGRWRSDFNIDTKYEMPFDDDFYIKIGLTFNYDNMPVEGASDTDYVFHTGFGWEW